MIPIEAVLISAAYVAVINFIGFAAFYADKRAARNGTRRIPEKSLLLIALCGGIIGCIYAQHKFRHKTKKQPFKFQLYAIAVLQIVLLIGLCFPSLRQDILSTVRDIYASIK